MTPVLAPSRRPLPARRLGTPPAGLPNATVVARDDLSPTIARFAVRPDAGIPPFAPGQYFALGLELDGRFVQRPYSAASAASDPVIEFAIRLVPDGLLTPALWRLGAGDRLRIGPPRGLFRLVDGDRRPHLLLATGTGIAPLVAMARALAAGDAPPVVIVHGAARADELAFGEELAGLARRRADWCYAPSISRPWAPTNGGWPGRVGRLDAILPALLRQLGLDPPGTVAYVCGNPAMVESVRDVLLQLGVDPIAIRAEPY